VGNFSISLIIRLPEYMKRMLIITGFAGNEQYMEDTTNRIINYIFNEKFEGYSSIILKLLLCFKLLYLLCQYVPSITNRMINLTEIIIKVVG